MVSPSPLPELVEGADDAAVAAFRQFCAPAIAQLKKQIGTMTQLPTPEQLKELLLALPFDDEALISSAITQEQLAMASATQEPAQELAAARKDKVTKCTSEQSHAARYRHNKDSHPQKWEDGKDNPQYREIQERKLREKLYGWPKKKKIKGSNGERIYVGRMLNEHFCELDKDLNNRLYRIPRYDDALDAIQAGQYHYEEYNGAMDLVFESSYVENGKKYPLRVVCKKKANNWHVLTYYTH